MYTQRAETAPGRYLGLQLPYLQIQYQELCGHWGGCHITDIHFTKGTEAAGLYYEGFPPALFFKTSFCGSCSPERPLILSEIIL